MEVVSPLTRDASISAETIVPVAFTDCRDCGSPRVGPFCSDCGQSVADEAPLRLRGMAKAFLQRLTGMDRGFLFTMTTLYRKGPGHVAYRFVEGERRRFVHPLLLVVLAAAFVLFTFRFYESAYIDLMETTFTQQFAAMGDKAAEIEETVGTPRVIAEGMVRLMKSNMTLLVLFNAFPMGVLMWFLYRGNGIRLAEWTVLGLYITAGVNFITALYNIWLFNSVGTEMSVWGMLPIVGVYSAFVVWGVKTFGERTWGDAFVGLLAYLISYVIAIIGGGVLGALFALSKVLMAQ